MILINDGSTDQTTYILEELSKKHSEVRVIQLEQNQGKANALQVGLFASKAEYLVCVDADALLADTAPYYM
ncbi:glycosyltransferase, partial [Bacillus sp. SIMBA_161]